MAAISSIMTQLKTHPTGLKENLRSICRELSIKNEPKDTRATMRGRIENFFQASSENELKVRDLITRIKSTHKE